MLNKINVSCDDKNLDSSTRLIKEAAIKRGITYTEIAFFEQKGFFHQIYRLTNGENTHMLDVTRPDNTSSIATTITINKELTKIFLQKHGLPSVPSETFDNFEDAAKYFKQIDFPCVVKPVDGGGGRGVNLNIKSLDDLKEAVKDSQSYNSSFLIERMLEGDDYRCLCIGCKVVSISKRVPPSVVGNGKSTVEELIDQINSTRSDKRTGMLSKIPKDPHLISHLKKQGLNLNDVLELNKKVFVRQNANLNTGGFSINYPVNKLHIKTKQAIEKAAKLVGLQVTGVDVMCRDLSEELSEDNGNIIEMNAKPRFRMHEAPLEGDPVPVSDYLIDFLFPETKLDNLKSNKHNKIIENQIIETQKST